METGLVAPTFEKRRRSAFGRPTELLGRTTPRWRCPTIWSTLKEKWPQTVVAHLYLKFWKTSVFAVGSAACGRGTEMLGACCGCAARSYFRACADSLWFSKYSCLWEAAFVTCVCTSFFFDPVSGSYENKFQPACRHTNHYLLQKASNYGILGEEMKARVEQMSKIVLNVCPLGNNTEKRKCAKRVLQSSQTRRAGNIACD